MLAVDVLVVDEVPNNTIRLAASSSAAEPNIIGRARDEGFLTRLRFPDYCLTVGAAMVSTSFGEYLICHSSMPLTGAGMRAT